MTLSVETLMDPEAAAKLTGLPERPLNPKPRGAAFGEMVVQLTSLPTGMMVLTNSGRLFFRELDNRNFDGRNPVKYIWREVEGPPL